MRGAIPIATRGLGKGEGPYPPRRHMYPMCVSLPLPYQFIHGWQSLQEGKIFLALLHRWQMYVCRLASEVLGVLHATHGAVKFRATVSARYADRAKLVSQGLEHHVAQVCQVQYLLHAGAFV